MGSDKENIERGGPLSGSKERKTTDVSLSAGTSAAPSLVTFFVGSTVRVKARLLIAFPVSRPL